MTEQSNTTFKTQNFTIEDCKFASIDEYNNITFHVNEATYNQLYCVTKGWLQGKSPLRIYERSDESLVYIIKVKLTKWDLLPATFEKKFRRVFGKNVTAQLQLKEFSFTTRSNELIEGWNATLVSLKH